jgi:zinc/manganese transport system substrate-binding protein
MALTSFREMNMNRVFACIWLLLLVPLPAKADLRIFACEPEWGALAAELAGDKASIFVATTAFQDVHHIQARPSLIAQVRRADLVVCTGAGLEAGWLPVLLRRSNNRKVLPGGSGYFLAADYVQMLEIPDVIDRAAGDIHAEGNPHIHLDPRNYVPITRALLQHLIDLDGDNADFYRRQGEDFLGRWQTALELWKHRAAPLENMPIVVYHDAWVYLNHWLGLDQLAELESKPGVPPTSSHLSAILKRLQREPAKAIIRAPFKPPRATEWLHDRTAITVLVLPYTVGGNPQAEDLFSLFDSTLSLLLGVSQ